MAVKGGMALYIGGMGARDKNFYNDLAKRLGYEEAAVRIQDLFLAGKKAEAAAAVPDALLDAVHLIGPKDRIRERLGAWKEAGRKGWVHTMNVSTLAARGARAARRGAAVIGASPVDREAIRRKYREERDKRLRPDGNDQYLQLDGQLRALPRRPVHAGPPREPQDRPRHVRLHRRRLRRPRHRRAPEGGRRRRRAHHREGRRLRRHLVLEPLPRRAVRHRVASSTCRCSKRPGTCRPRSTRTRRRSSSTAGASASSSASTSNALFHTEVQDLAWDDERSRWIVRTEPRRRVHRPVRRHGHRARCTSPSSPAFPGIETFRGHSFHTSRWDYDYTGGDPTARRWTSSPTSASRSSAPAPPRCSASRTSREPCGDALRVPAHAVVGRRARQRARSIREWFASIATPAGSSAGWRTSPPTRRAARPTEDLVKDGWTDLARRIREQDHGAAARGVHARGHDGGVRGLRLREDGGDPRARRRDRRRTRRRRRSSRPGTASCASGRASTTSTCRPSTPPSTHLIDTDGKGVERITETGVVVARRRVRGRLHHLRVGLRGRHRLHAAQPASTWSAATA